MKIDGRAIAQGIKDQLKLEVNQLIEKGVSPHLVVIIVGNDPASLTYITQKKRIGEEIGAKVSIYNLPTTTPLFELKKLTFSLNNDPSVHGIIVQRPTGLEMTKEQQDTLIVPQKDIDGFHPQSPFTPPIALAVTKILQWILNDMRSNPSSPLKIEEQITFPAWLSKQRVLVIGRGETAGIPIAAAFQKMGVRTDIAYSTTKYMDALMRASNIIISCVGKPDIVRHEDISNKTIVIGVGLHQERTELTGDFNQEQIGNTAAYFTPTPGGIGPINVVCLFENLITAVVQRKS
jgi:methylenetetrahydrofolate dehydrogenase (NADP+) / methenyltetrahydrofolate cyclohydrolase